MGDTVSVLKGDLDILVAAVTSWAPHELPGDVHNAFARLLHVFDQAHADDDTPASEPKPVTRYALVEQMGHRATVGTVREVTFCGKPMLELGPLAGGSVHLVAPDSLYELTWLTEDEARARAKPWTATAIGAGGLLACAEDAEAAEDDGPFYVEADATPPHPPLRGPQFPSVQELGGEQFADWPQQ